MGAATEARDLSLWAVSNVIETLLTFVEDGVPKLKAKATASEIRMLAEGIESEHPGWIHLQHIASDYDEIFQIFSSYIKIEGCCLSLMFKSTFREIYDEDRHWEDINMQGEVRYDNGVWSDKEEFSRWIFHTLMLVHRHDNIRISVPVDQRWY